jgi:hypothetical protein
MPITPFHFGPGALIKAAAPATFSWAIFALANIFIDLEPITLYFVIGDPAHPWLHTFPGAIVVAGVAAVFGRKPCERLLNVWNRQLDPGWQQRYLAVEPKITTRAAWTGALIGTLSHLGLDSIMHADIEPLWPLVSGNAIQGWMSLEILHGLCVMSAVLAPLLAFISSVRGRGQQNIQELSVKADIRK